jgi:hypothetical protein
MRKLDTIYKKQENAFKEDGTHSGSLSRDGDAEMEMCGEEVELLDRTILTTLHVVNMKSR